MNPFLKDIFDQPKELMRVLDSLLTKYKTQVYKIAEKFNNASEIVLTSMGSAYYSLMPMYYALQKSGHKVSLIETSELLRNSTLIDDRKFFFLMSRSGESYEVAKLPEILRERNIDCACITMTQDSTMAKNIPLVLYDCSSYDSLVCTKAYSTMALCGLICVSAMNSHPESQEFCRPIYDMLVWMEENKEKILSQIEKIPYCSVVPNFYLLSRGCGMGVIESASLWLEETARKCACVSTIDNFYHGPIEVSKTDTVPLYLDLFPDSRSDMIWNKICSYSDCAIYLGPEYKQFDKCFSIYYPNFNVEDEYKMIFLAMYFQMLAYQCALSNGLEPGKLETVSWVVK